MNKDLRLIREKLAERIKTSRLRDLWFYQEHFLVVEKFAKKLLRLYPNANKEAVMLAAWFHDVSCVYAKKR